MDRLAMNVSERKEYQSVILATLLHDIGKFLHRKNEITYKTGHQRASALFIDEHQSKLKNDDLYDLGLIKFLARHHMAERNEKREDVLSDPFFQTLQMDKERAWKLLTIVRDADIYSCAERERDEYDRKGFANRLEPLKPIFQNIDLSTKGPSSKDGLNYHLRILGPLECFPEKCERLTDQEFEALIDKFETALPDFSKYRRFDDVINKWLDILHRYTCCVPSDTRYDGPDVSLYDHSRSSAAFAACLYRVHLQSIKDNQHFKRGHEFILVGGDYSGIQDYIFHITNRGSGGASKRLRARSFFVYLFSEATIHKILHALDLPLVCNLFSAGGKFLLLAPNIQGVPDALEKTKTEIDMEISRTYFNQFSFLLSRMEINGYKTRKQPNELGIYTFNKSADDMFHRLETEKVKKFRSILVESDLESWLPAAFKGSRMYEQYKEAGDCKICGSGPGTEQDIDQDTKEVTMCCPVCYRDKYRIGEQLPKAKFIAFGKGVLTPDAGTADERIILFHPAASDNGAVREGYYAELLQVPRLTSDHYLLYNLSSDVNETDGDMQRPSIRKFCANHVPTENNRILTFEEIAARSLWKDGDYTYGSNLLGVLKVDIDNLGLIFSKGFEKPSRLEKDRDEIDRKTVSRFLTLSRMVDLFFSGWIKDIMTADKEITIQQLLKIKDIDLPNFENYLRSPSVDFKDIYTVYSGGDDLVLVGPWETMIVFAVYMDSRFREYTCYNDYLTLSAGLAFVKDKHPIASAIQQADELLQRSKTNGKRSISLFGTTVQWDSLPRLADFFLFLNGELNKAMPQINVAFLHRLLEYHRMAVNFIDNRSTKDLRYVSALSYDIGRNIIKMDKDDRPTEGFGRYEKLTNLIKEKPDRDSLMYNLKIPLFWALYRSRGYRKDEYLRDLG